MFNGNFEFLFELPVFEVLTWVLILILVDTIFGIIHSISKSNFDWKELPRFLGTNVIPYCFGLFVLAVIAEYLGQVFDYVFYAVSIFVFARYIAKLYEKIKNIYGFKLKK